MTTGQNICDLIRRRSSWRTYVPEDLDQKIRTKMEALLAEKHLGPFPGDARFELIELPAEAALSAKSIGTYGMIKGARYYIAGAIRRGPMSLENYGYLFERIILEATAMGLATCWLGGALHRSDIGRRIVIREDEYIPAISPVGRAIDQRDLRDRLIRWSAGSKNRKPWDQLFFYDRFSTPLRKADVPDYAEPLEMVRLAPSASNRQPWRIVKEGGRPRFHFYLQKNRVYGTISQTLLGAEEIQRLDMGIAMCHFALAANERQLKGRWLVAEPEHIEPPEGARYTVSWIED